MDSSKVLALLERVLDMVEDEYRETLQRMAADQHRRTELEQTMTQIARLMDEARHTP